MNIVIFSALCGLLACSGLDLAEEPVFLDGVFIANKVVGRTAAALMILGGIEQVYIDTVSLHTLEMLEDRNVEISARQVVTVIENHE